MNAKLLAACFACLAMWGAGMEFAAAQQYETSTYAGAQIATSSVTSLWDAPPVEYYDVAACEHCADLTAELPDCGPVNWVTFAGFDSWRGVADGSYQNNNGAHVGANAAGPLPWLEDTGWAWQFGGSFGIYDWNGRESSFAEFSAAQQQIFVTAGVFRRAHAGSNWSYGVVVDHMFADNFGILANEPHLCQLRYQVAYALSTRNEIGFWGTNALNTGVQSVFNVPIVTRAVSQANLFWHHKFALGADLWFYAGVPTNGRVGGDGTLGDFQFGAMGTLPLNDQWSLYANFAYLDPSAPQAFAAEEDSFNVTVGLAWYPGRNAISRTVAGRTWMPYLPVANNGTFLVDQNLTF